MVLLTALVLAASPVDALVALSRKKAWDELYLSAAPLKEEGLTTAQRATASAALLEGCQALQKSDPVLALSLGEKAVAMKASSAASRCVEHASEALEARERPAEAPPERVPSTSHGKTSTSFESGADEEGRRTRSNEHFRFRYFNGKRDFGQRAQYELGVQEALDLARREAERFVGERREKAVDVVLYSKQEFAMHHGASAALAVAGFYSEDSIRMNDSAAMTPQNQATLVHEYVHALVDELSGFHDENVPTWLNEGLAEWVEWQHLRQDGPNLAMRTQLRSASAAGRVPSLLTVTKGPLLAHDNAGALYALSAVAVGELVGDRGMRSVVDVIREVGRGTPLAKALNKNFGRTVQELDARVADALKRR